MKKIFIFYLAWVAIIYTLLALWFNALNPWAWDWPGQYLFIVIGLIIGAVLAVTNSFRQ